MNSKAENYIKRMEGTTNRNEMEGIRIEFSQDKSLKWADFMECYNAYIECKSEIGISR
mgnify:CR=1 FL=1